MFGVLLIGFAWALARVLGPSYLAPAFIGYFGLVAIVHGLALPCDLGCKGNTTTGLLHNMTGISGFAATVAAMFLLARQWWDDADWVSHARFTRRIAFVAVGGLAWFVITQALDTPLGGIAQRIFVGALLLWIAVTAWKLYRQIDTGDPVMGSQAGGGHAAQ